MVMNLINDNDPNNDPKWCRRGYVPLKFLIVLLVKLLRILACLWSINLLYSFLFRPNRRHKKQYKNNEIPKMIWVKTWIGRHKI